MITDAPRVRIRLVVPVDTAWLERQASTTGEPPARVLLDLANQIENRVVDAARWIDGVAAVSVTHRLRVEGAGERGE